MKTNIRVTARFGDLVVAAFDRAARYSLDPREVSRLARLALLRLLQRARVLDLSARVPALASVHTGYGRLARGA